MASQLMDNIPSKFSTTIKKLSSHTHHRVNDKKTINTYLQELNDLNYQTILTIDNDGVMLLINRLCTNIQVWESELVMNYCKFLTNITRLCVKITGRTLLTCKKWIFQVLEFSDDEIKSYALISLKNIIDISTFDDCSQDLEALIGEGGLFPKLVSKNSPEITNLTGNCLEALLNSKEAANKPLPLKYAKLMRELIVEVLSSPTTCENTSLQQGRTIRTFLKILTTLITEIPEKSPEIIGETLGIVQVYLFHGIPGFSPIKPEQLRPAVMNLPERIHVPPKGRNPRQMTKSKGKKTKKTEKNIDTKFVVKSSDSETSDGETSFRKSDGGVRMESLKLLREIMNGISSKEMFGYWPQIITNSDAKSRVLLRLILNEPMSKVRQNALSLLTDAIIDARMFLIHADEAEHPSFITIFGTVAAMIKEIHLLLALFLSSERNVAVITQALKCSAALIQVTPYNKLTGLATKLSRHCRHFLLHKDPTIRVVALSVFEAFANVETMTPEVSLILFKKSGETNLFKKLKKLEEVEADFESFDLDDRGNEESTFLVEICLNNISDKKINVPVRLQSLKLLAALINRNEEFSERREEILIITRHLVEATAEADPQIALHACRVIETMSSKLAAASSGDDRLMDFWNNVFASIAAVSQSLETILREVACDCFGTISNGVFTQLASDKSIIIKTTLFGACRDEESAVRAAGLRALGMLINLASLEEDTGFVEDLADVVCKSMEDENLGVRIKAAWALANLTDCLIKQEKNDEIEVLRLEIILPNLYKYSVRGAEDNNKVKCNALRAVGNVLYLSQGKKVLGDVSLALKALVSSATCGNDMKVRWNACRALGFAISYNPDGFFPQNWRDEVIPPLCDLICHSPNFKVRTNAAWALASCKCYGKYVPFLWKSIVLALDNAQHVPNFVEYAHRDSLVEQLCLTLGHVAARTDPSDLQVLWPDIKDHVYDMEVHMTSFQEKVLPEKTDDFVRAKLILKNYSQTMSLDSNDRFIADILANLFSRRNFYDELKNTVLF